MKKAFLLLAAVATLSSCQRDEPKPLPNEDVASLKEQFHGKYEIIAATSAIAVDLNEDGRSSADLLKEVPELAFSNMVILVGKNLPDKKKYLGMIDVAWQTQQLLRVRNPGGPDSFVVWTYANQITNRYFNFNTSLTQLELEQLPAVPGDNGQFPAPESVSIVGPEQLLVVTNRLLYVQKVWTPVRVTALYKRYTKGT